MLTCQHVLMQIFAQYREQGALLWRGHTFAQFAHQVRMQHCVATGPSEAACCSCAATPLCAVEPSTTVNCRSTCAMHHALHHSKILLRAASSLATFVSPVCALMQPAITMPSPRHAWPHLQSARLSPSPLAPAPAPAPAAVLRQPAGARQGPPDAHPLRQQGAVLPDHIIAAGNTAATRSGRGIRHEGACHVASSSSSPAMLLTPHAVCHM
jgi:hypothetical protein